MRIRQGEHMRELLKLEIDNITIEGDLVVPESAHGLIIFSHGSGSSRFSPRNNFVAQHLQRLHFATYLFDLLTRKEDGVLENRFNIKLLSRRLIEATRQLIAYPATRNIPFGYFGASTGAAAAITAASVLQDRIKAVVLRGGRPDLSMSDLPKVRAATLLIVGELDKEVINLNQQALAKLSQIKSLQVIKGATHLFDEPGTLEQVAEVSAQWFTKYIVAEPIFNAVGKR